MRQKLNENTKREFDEKTIKVYGKLLNKIMKKKYDWFDKINVNQLTYSNVGLQPYVGIVADIFVDEDWGGNQWADYNYPRPVPNPDEELSFGDIVGGDLSYEITNIFLIVFQMVTGLKAKHISFSWIDTYFVNINKKNLDEQITKIQSIIGFINEDKKIDFIYNFFDNIFDELKLIKTMDDLYQYDWVDKNGDKVFERNHWGMLWIYNCDLYRNLKMMLRLLLNSNNEFLKELLNYLNNKYFKEFGEKKPLKDVDEDCDYY
jgi:hypothetical protein